MCPKAQEVWQMATKDKDVSATGHELRAILLRIPPLIRVTGLQCTLTQPQVLGTQI